LAIRAEAICRRLPKILDLRIMLKKSAIFGIVLLVIGSTVLGWIRIDRRDERRRAASRKMKYGSEPDEYLKRYDEWLKLPPQERAAMPLQVNGYGQAKTELQLRAEQQERLDADLDKLAAGELDAHPFADVLYGENWQDEVRKHIERQERSEFVLTGSVVCTSIGGTTFGCCLILWVARLLIAGISRLRGSSVEADLADHEGSSETFDAGIKEPSEASSVRAARPDNWKPCVSAGSQRPDAETDCETFETTQSPMDRKKIPVLISGKKPTKSEEPSPRSQNRRVSEMMYSGGGQGVSQTVLTQRQEDAATLEASLKAHAKELEKQMDEFRRMHNARQSGAEQPRPFNSALEDLTEQVSAIREYASHQQERVEKLQDGYDWSIIRTFCLRVIRCIDNLESRIERLSSKDGQTGHLEEVKDELIFALEAGGVEQFRPEINTLYRGQEKSTEAVKEKEHCDKAENAGMIAEVVRPGYQYFIDEGNFKVIRAAQVKLFG